MNLRNYKTVLSSVLSSFGFYSRGIKCQLVKKIGGEKKMREPKQEKLEEDDDEEQTELVWTNTREFTP